MSTNRDIDSMGWRVRDLVLLVGSIAIVAGCAADSQVYRRPYASYSGSPPLSVPSHSTVSLTLTGADEQLLDDLHDAARRLDDRLCSIERIMTAENPNWRQQCLPEATSSRQRLLADEGEAR